MNCPSCGQENSPDTAVCGACGAVVGPVAASRRLARGRFVGRREELALLAGQLAACLTRRGSPVMLVGESGIGKTRIAQEFAAEARRQGAAVL